MRKKSLESLSSHELYALAEKKEHEEEAKRREELTAKVSALRSERRRLIKGHKKALASVDTDIRHLKGGRPGARGTSSKVLEIVLDGGEIHIDAIRDALQKAGETPGNLNQTLAYLKRTGRIASGASRGSYKAP